MAHHDRLEPLADGFIAFYTKKGERWKHRDVEASSTGPGYRLFVSDRGEQRRYTFGPAEPHDVTVFDLRDQLERATRVDPQQEEAAAGAPHPPNESGHARHARRHHRR